jgi:hypothetical protein
MKKVLSEIAYRIHRNPVLVATAALWGFDALHTGSPITLHGAIVVGIGVIVRSKVVPAHEVEVLTDFIASVGEELAKGASRRSLRKITRRQRGPRFGGGLLRSSRRRLGACVDLAARSTPWTEHGGVSPRSLNPRSARLRSCAA